MAELVLAALVCAGSVLFAGPRGWVRGLGSLLAALRGSRALMALSVLLVGLLLVLGDRVAGNGDPAGFQVEWKRYLAGVLATSVAFAALTALCLHRGSAAAWAGGRAARLRTVHVALLTLLLSSLANQLVLEGVPHANDEVSYQFQARALASGRLAFATPARPEFFAGGHTFADGEVWYGIMNPGWPAVLALGYAAGLPWLVNPLLAAATLFVLAAFLRRAGVEDLCVRLTVLLVGISPWFVFMAGTYMAHTLNLFLLTAFLWACVRLRERGGLGFAAIAGLALGLNMAVRPLDAAVSAAPFCALLALDLRRHPRRVGPLALVGLLAAGGAASLLAYNQELTGEPRLFPQERYFDVRFPGEGFGLGFGESMGTRLHGPEWPGYSLRDAPVVTSHRTLQLLRDVCALPFGLVLALVWFLSRRGHGTYIRVLAVSAGLLFAVYLAHFYHGIAYGSRHYFLALPLLGLALATPLSCAWTAGPGRAACFALLLHVGLVAYPPLLRSYSDRYRGASGSVREAVEKAGLARALVFVSGENWGWKSAFPLNEYPLEASPVIFALDRGAENESLRRIWPDRAAYHLSLDAGGRVTITSLPQWPDAEDAGHRDVLR